MGLHWKGRQVGACVSKSTVTDISFRLAMAAGLHAIESNNFSYVTDDTFKDFDRPHYSGAMSKHWAIPPAQDPVDHAERIGTLCVRRAGHDRKQS